MKTVIIGGVAGGASAAARLRRLDEKAEIVVFERGPYVSFANCGLPYYIGGEIKERSRLTLQTPESFRNRFNIDVRVNSTVTEIDPTSKTVTAQCPITGEYYSESFDTLILAPGAEPLRPQTDGLDGERVFTLRNIPDAQRIKDFVDEKKPRSCAVVGGGYIGVEMAENLTNAGLEVTVIELSDHLLAPLDFDMASEIHRHMRDKGVRLILSNGVRAVSETNGKLRITLENGTAEADMIVLCVGVRPETDLAKQCRIMTNRRGSVIVDSHMRTNIPFIYAVGDAVEVKEFLTGEPAFIPLAGPANRQGRVAADCICGYESTYNGTQGSSVVRIFDMTVAATGLNEAAAKKAGIDYDKTYIYSGSHASYYPGSENMTIKALWDRASHRLLGAQTVGFGGVDKRADVLAAAIRFGAVITDLAGLELCYAPPFSSAKDPVNMLGFVAENVITGKMKQFFPDEVDSLPRDGSVTLLDTRTPAEYARGNIAGFVNIPLDSLRDRLGELPAGKPVYVHCHSGLRSYIACRILTGNGFECFNLAGGWRMYESLVHERSVPEYVCTECEK